LTGRPISEQTFHASLPRPREAVLATNDFASVARLPAQEANTAKRFLERESIQCRIERDTLQGGFETFAILVPAIYFDQAAEILNQHEAEILTHKPTEQKLSADDPDQT
jgi:hypothetical protein